MTSLRKIELANVVAELPEPSKAPAHAERVDLLITVLGFEERAVSAIEQFKASGGQAGRAVVLRYSTNVTDNQVNELHTQEVLRDISANITTIEATAPVLGDELGALLPSSGVTQRVILDISVASNQLVLRMFKTLLSRDIELSLIYAEAAEYFPTREEMIASTDDDDKTTSSDSNVLSDGIGQVDVAVEYPGQHLDALPHLVLLFPGFSTERARAALSAIDPALLTDSNDGTVWFIGRPHLEADSWRQEALEQLHSLAPDSRRIAVSTFDYRQTLQELDRVYIEHEGRRRMTLVPMGSKLQALGASLFCYLRPDVSALFATPATYNAAHYSRGCKDVWQLDLGSTASLRAALDRVGQLELVD
jgi:hypothetical protein